MQHAPLCSNPAATRWLTMPDADALSGGTSDAAAVQGTLESARPQARSSSAEQCLEQDTGGEAVGGEEGAVGEEDQHRGEVQRSSVHHL